MTYEIKYRKEGEMKDSGIEWLGKVPKDWEISKFKRYISINSGREILDEDNDYNKLINVYGSGGIFKKTSKILYSGEATLFGRKGTIGKPIYVNEEFWTVDTMYYSTCNKDFFPKNLYYILLTIPWNLVSTQTALPSVVGSDIGNLYTVVPKLQNQQKIANFLDLKTAEFDSIISKKEDLIEKLEEAKKSLISEVVTGKVKILDGELVERKADEMEDSGVEWLGMIPKVWTKERLKYLVSIDTGNKDTQDKVEDGLYPFYVRSDTVERINSYSYNGESILTAGDGVGVGRVFHYVEGKFAYHQRVYKLSKFKNIQGKYLYYYVSENFHKEVMKLSAKSTVDSLRLPMFNNFIIVFPDFKLQEKISEFLDFKIAKINSIITKTKLQIKKLKQAKQSLISEAVTGKIDLRDWEIQQI